MSFIPGQRWISTAEPELGLGTVLRCEGRSVQLLYATSGVIRHYAQQSAPLLRVEFKPGDRIQCGGGSLVVERVETHAGLIHYHGEGKIVPEGELDDAQNVSKADERLISGRVDRVDQFDFRMEALQRRAAARRALTYGIGSSRVDLIPHQLRVAEIAYARRPLRVLLADEVGLGKTIEAGLILARLLASGRVNRILVLLPASLVHQWFVELLRRFNLSFSIFDEERCEAIEPLGSSGNPFDHEQLVITDLGFVIGSAQRSQQLLAGNWDMLVVDEAHHLTWTPTAASAEYQLVERLAETTRHVVLLTATPEQLGHSGHFARLRLLDPARYHDLSRYLQEAEGYVRLSQISQKLQDATELTKTELAEIAARLTDDPQLQKQLTQYSEGKKEAAGALLDALIDRHGTGRVMFRNRRVQVGGFPCRIAELSVLDAADLGEEERQRLLAEFISDVQQPPAALELNYNDDPRLPWLLALIENLSPKKLLLICRSQAKVLALEEVLRVRSGVKVARFHEGMTIVQRDRNAAYFAEPDGARLMLCAEIGSEGRNFQFAHHLILWDLPLDPDLLEQRIGRLDRIGQKNDITLHAMAFAGTAQQVLLRWYEQGLDAFRLSPADGRELTKRYAARLIELAQQHAHCAEETDAEMQALITETRSTHEELSALIHAGRDHLLEIAAQRQAPDGLLQTALAQEDADVRFDAFVLRLFEQFGIENDEHGPRTYLLDPEYLSTDGFPGLKDGPQTITFDRATALRREDFPLLRADHPLVSGALDLLLLGEQGNCAFLADDALPKKTVLLECLFVLECVSAQKLHVDRFLPATPIRVVIDTRLQPRDEYRPHPASLARARDHEVEATRYRKYLATLVPPMLKRAEELVRDRAMAEITNALAAMETSLGKELVRLRALQRVNLSIRDEEIRALDDELNALRKALPLAHTRLDAIRFVCSADFLSLR